MVKLGDYYEPKSELLSSLSLAPIGGEVLGERVFIFANNL